MRSPRGEERLVADAYVLALGSYSPLAARGLGLDIPVYPAKGYSASVPVADAAKAPRVSLTDDGAKIVFSRLGERLRIAGTAELSGYSTELNPVRCEALIRRARRDLSRGGRLRARDVLGGVAPVHAVQRPAGGAHALCEPVPQHRARHARLDHGLRVGSGACGYHLGSGSRSRFPVHGLMVTLQDIQAAAKVLAGQVLDTPCLPSRTLSEITGAQVYLKFENHQFTASFKERGALNKLLVASIARRRPRASSPARRATTPRAWPTTRTASASRR